MNVMTRCDICGKPRQKLRIYSVIRGRIWSVCDRCYPKFQRDQEALRVAERRELYRLLAYIGLGLLVAAALLAIRFWML